MKTWTDYVVDEAISVKLIGKYGFEIKDYDNTFSCEKMPQGFKIKIINIRSSFIEKKTTKIIGQIVLSINEMEEFKDWIHSLLQRSFRGPIDFEIKTSDALLKCDKLSYGLTIKIYNKKASESTPSEFLLGLNEMEKLDDWMHGY